MEIESVTSIPISRLNPHLNPTVTAREQANRTLTAG